MQLCQAYNIPERGKRNSKKGNKKAKRETEIRLPFVSKLYIFAIKRDIHHFRWMFSFYHRDMKDSKPERALSVKQNSMDYCFVAKRCEDGYRNRQIWVVKQCKKSSIYCVLLPLPSSSRTTQVCDDFLFKNVA